eukprot:Polyplicarium_translucidae@DN1486_c0_g1_i1.p1
MRRVGCPSFSMSSKMTPTATEIDAGCVQMDATALKPPDITEQLSFMTPDLRQLLGPQAAATYANAILSTCETSVQVDTRPEASYQDVRFYNMSPGAALKAPPMTLTSALPRLTKNPAACQQTILTLHPLQPNTTTQFEVKVMDSSPSTVWALGIAPRHYPCFRLPGLQDASAAYYSDGRLIVSGKVKVAQKNSRIFGVKDVVTMSISRSFVSVKVDFFRGGVLQHSLQKRWGGSFVAVGCVGEGALRCRLRRPVELTAWHMPADSCSEGESGSENSTFQA